MREFKGFLLFWKDARKVWSLSEALNTYHNNRLAWLALELALDRKSREQHDRA